MGALVYKNLSDAFNGEYFGIKLDNRFEHMGNSAAGIRLKWVASSDRTNKLPLSIDRKNLGIVSKSSFRFLVKSIPGLPTNIHE